MFPRSDPAAIVVAVQRFSSVYGLIVVRCYSPHIIFVGSLSQILVEGFNQDEHGVVHQSGLCLIFIHVHNELIHTFSTYKCKKSIPFSLSFFVLLELYRFAKMESKSSVNRFFRFLRSCGRLYPSIGSRISRVRERDSSSRCGVRKFTETRVPRALRQCWKTTFWCSLNITIGHDNRCIRLHAACLRESFQIHRQCPTQLYPEIPLVVYPFQRIIFAASCNTAKIMQNARVYSLILMISRKQ